MKSPGTEPERSPSTSRSQRNSMADPKESSLEGWVLRKSSMTRSFSHRYLILHGSSLLVCRKERDKPYQHLQLSASTILRELQEGRRHWHVCVMLNGGCEFRFAHKNEEAARKWHTAITNAILEAARCCVSFPERESMDSVASQSSVSSTPRGKKEYGRTPAAIKVLLDEAVEDRNRIFEKVVTALKENDNKASGMDKVEALNFYHWRTYTVEGGLRIRIDDEDCPFKFRKEAQRVNRAIQLATAAGLGLAIVLRLLVLSEFFVSLLCGVCASLYVLWTLVVGAEDTENIRAPWLQSAEVVSGSVESVLGVLMDKERWPRIDGAIAQMEIVERIDEHTDILHVEFKPMWKWVMWLKPRDVCLLRYWRREEDGSALIVLQSTLHQKCPAKKGCVRAVIQGAAWSIHPQNDPNQRPEVCRVVFTIKYDPMGVISWFTNFSHSLDFVMPLLRNVTALKDAMAYQGFHTRAEDTGTEHETAPEEETPDLSTSMHNFHTSVDASGLVRGVRTLECTAPPGSWAEPHGSRFMVRGANYLKDKVKASAGPSGFNLVALDVFSFEDPSQRYNVAARPDNIVCKINNEDGVTDVPYTFVINFIVPCPDNLAVVCYFQPALKNWREVRDNFTELLEDFIDGDDTFRNNRFKLIPKIESGPFILRKAVAGRPAIIGNKGLRVPYHSGDNYFEVDIDVNSDAHARELTWMAVGQTTKLVVDIAFTIEAQSEDELPECVLGAVRFNKIDLKKFCRVPKDAPCTVDDLPPDQRPAPRQEEALLDPPSVPPTPVAARGRALQPLEMKRTPSNQATSKSSLEARSPH
eukprot:comp20647_c0_seq1/m.26751 comp20647_c0_seq1/g.26751  ORF comp20647_c0_seq1/g.26751 comp20647_c0_seq1/m.26751 type:complete len:811 (-) comp20647_c0_seq1:145-2577(-)